MVCVLAPGKKQVVTEVICGGCDATLSVRKGEWRDGDYGSEKHVSCPSCGHIVVKPGTEYRGDF